MTTEEWRHVARALGRHYQEYQGDDSLAAFDEWADYNYQDEAQGLIVAFDAITEYRSAKADPTGGYRVNASCQGCQPDDDIERVARRMARSHARDLDILPEGIDGVVDRQWPNYRDAATEHLNQLRSGNA